MRKWSVPLLALVLVIGLIFLLIGDVRDGSVVGGVVHIVSFAAFAFFAVDLWKSVKDQ